MKIKTSEKVYFFVDESGDPYFYNRKGNYIVGKEGCSKLLILGFIKTKQPDLIRTGILNLQSEIEKDEYLDSIPSIKKSIAYFHATDDSSELREKVFKLIKTFPFNAEFYVGRKIELLFKSRHLGRPNLFYYDLIINLFQNHLHTSKLFISLHYIFISKAENIYARCPY